MSSNDYNPEVMDLEFNVYKLEEALQFKTPDKLPFLMSTIEHLNKAWKVFDKRVFYGHCILSHNEYRTIQRVVQKTIQIGEERANTWNLLLSFKSEKANASVECST